MNDQPLDPPRRGVTRRDSLKLSTAALVAAAAAPAARADAPSRGASPPAAAAPRFGRRARNVILLVSDGMSSGVLSMAQPFAERVRAGGRLLNWVALSRDPRAAAGLYDCGSLNALVTDSAAAATAWSTGERVNNGSLNVTPDGRELTPIAERVKATGRRVGLVTTTRVTHATPAAFAAVSADRNAEDAIAPQFLDRADVVMGGGRRHFAAHRRGDGRDLIDAYRAAGFDYWDRRDRVVAGGGAERVLGLFGESHLPYKIDHRNDDELWRAVPTLGEMTRAALGLLDRGEGFLLQVEGGRVDHACHANDAAAALWDQLAFDDAVGVALEFAATRDDTLVVVTTDHGNANPGLNGMGKAYGRTDACFDRLASARQSFEWLGEMALTQGGDPGVLVSLAADYLGVQLTDAEAAEVAEAWRERPGPDDELNAQHRGRSQMLAQAVGNHTGVQFTGRSHTQDWAILHAFGPGAHRFAGCQKNTDLHAHLAAALSLAPAAAS